MATRDPDGDTDRIDRGFEREPTLHQQPRRLRDEDRHERVRMLLGWAFVARGENGGAR